MYKDQLYSIPSGANEFDDFQQSMVSRCTTNAAAWNLPGDVITEMAAKQTEWEQAYGLTSNRKTSSPSATAARNLLMESYRSLLDAVMHDHIVGNVAIGEADRTALGIHLRSKVRVPASAPSTTPILQVDNSEVSAHHILFHDSATPTSAKRSPDAGYCELYYKVDGTQPAGPEEAPLRCNISRSGQKVPFTNGDKGKTAYYFARWVSSKGEAGPWSPMVSALVN